MEITLDQLVETPSNRTTGRLPFWPGSAVDYGPTIPSSACGYTRGQVAR